MALLSSFIMLSSITATADFPTNNTRYISYDLSTGEETIIDTRAYQCDVDSVESNMISRREVIGSDERTLVTDTTISPYKGIGYLQAHKPSQADNVSSRGTCSAFSKNAVLTAAHVIWDSKANAPAISYKISFAKNDSVLPYGTITLKPTKVIIPEQYKNTGSASYDYAIILYNTTISNYTFGFSKAATTGDVVTVTGYPQDVSTAGGTTKDHRQWTHSGNIISSSESTISYKIDTSGGQSGAPVYNASNKIVAVHHGGTSISNTARKLDTSLFNIMYQIRNGTYVS